MLRLPVFSAALLAASSPAWAALGAGQTIRVFGGDAISHQDAVNTMNTYAIPMTPISAAMSVFKVVPGWQTLSNDFQSNDETLSGLALAASYTRGIRAHWAWTVLGAYSRLTGDVVGFEEYSGTSDPNFQFAGGPQSGTFVARQRVDKTGHGLQGAVALIYDPFDDPDGERLPIMFGLGGMKLEHDVDAVAPSSLNGNDLRMTVTRDTFVTTLFTAVSYQFNAGPFRVAPVLGFNFRLGGDDQQSLSFRDASTQAVLYAQSNGEVEAFFPSGGLFVEYRPWGLSFGWVPNLQWALAGFADDEPLISTFSFTKKFAL